MKPQDTPDPSDTDESPAERPDPLPKRPAAGVSRRSFLAMAGAASAAGALACAPAVETPEPASEPDDDVDVAVVGGGCAGPVAALFAHAAGARVALYEKAPILGGTTAKSGGVYWIPNNRFLRETGSQESRGELLTRMARHSYPDLFDPAEPRLGLPALEYELLVAFYENASLAVDALDAMGALVSQPAWKPFGKLPDYFDTETSDAEPIDRRLWPRKPDGSFGLGDEMARQLQAALAEREIPVHLKHRMTGLLRNRGGDVVGIRVRLPDGGVKRIRARRGVVVASGGFTHNPELIRSYQPGPVYGGCAAASNEGDFVYAATAVGAKLGHMQSAWRAQVVFEQASQFSMTPDDVFMPPGDSMFLVNRFGRRVVNEKSNYNERTRVHFHWDPVRHEWPNRLLFMVYDQRSAELFAGRYPLPPPGTQAPYVVRGDSLDGLASALGARLDELASETGHVRLAPEFAAGLQQTAARFGGFARSGVDEDFGRGRLRYDRMWHSRIWSYPNSGTKWAPNEGPNPTMHPLAASGPYFAIILASGTLDTNGGPVVNSSGAVLRADGQPVPGLFGAGNCVAAPTGRYYYGGGGTLGPAVTFGYLAGRSAAAAPEKPWT